MLNLTDAIFIEAMYASWLAALGITPPAPGLRLVFCLKMRRVFRED